MPLAGLGALPGGIADGCDAGAARGAPSPRAVILLAAKWQAIQWGRSMRSTNYGGGTPMGRTGSCIRCVPWGNSFRHLTALNPADAATTRQPGGGTAISHGSGVQVIEPRHEELRPEPTAADVAIIWYFSAVTHGNTTSTLARKGGPSRETVHEGSSFPKSASRMRCIDG